MSTTLNSPIPLELQARLAAQEREIVYQARQMRRIQLVLDGPAASRRAQDRRITWDDLDAALDALNAAVDGLENLYAGRRTNARRPRK